MTEDMQVRNLSPHTRNSYVQQISLFARHFSKSPERLGPDEIRSYQVYLTNERKLAPSTILIAIAALRFLYKVTLHKDCSLKEIIPAQPRRREIVDRQAIGWLFFASCVLGVREIDRRTEGRVAAGSQPVFTRYTSSITLDRADGHPTSEVITRDEKPNDYNFNDVVLPPYSEFYRKITNHPPPRDTVLDILLLLNALGTQGWELVYPVDVKELSAKGEPSQLGKWEYLLKRTFRAAHSVQ
jgi:hypothetical protein